MVIFDFITDLVKYLQVTYSQTELPSNWTITPELCPENMDGDLTINCFRFARFFKMAPEQLSSVVSEYLSSHRDINKAEMIKAFVNITLKAEAAHRQGAANIQSLFAAGTLQKEMQKRILIEYSAPNTNKPQHLGHVRNNTLGMALASLMRRVGHDVIEINLVNDRGIHICKSMIAYQRWGNNATPESTGIKGDHLVGNYYVKFNTELKKELDILRLERPELAQKTDDELFLETELGSATQKMLQDWEAGNPNVRELWQMMNSWVFKGFDETYRRIGIKFDRTYLESETYMLGKDLVASGLTKGIFKKREDGAIFIELDKLGPKVVLRSDGTSVYITQDIGTTLEKFKDYHPDSQIWVVGDEQILHFKMLFAILKKMGYQWADNLHHLSYGMVNLPTGKMKSREGTVVDADELFEEMVELSKNAIKERAGDTISIDELNSRAEIIGIGALKFMLLKFNPKTTMMFDPEASLKFEGDTGPYVQYACARINSIARKAAECGLDPMSNDTNWNLATTKEERAVSLQLWLYPQILRSATEKKDCSVLVEYLLNTAKTFNRFYRECPVLNADNEPLKCVRLRLCLAVREVLSDGLNTLTIQVPDAM
ncbi:MAG: arginine--tRNA ligase [Victivallaceae bacterium]|nr:arginine--tRNA ligase [Victivallaceae bacterium]